MKKQFFYGREITKEHPRYKKIQPHQKITSGLNVYCENVESFWTKKEYTLQELIINAIVVHREPLDNSKKTHPYARIDIIYDGLNGIGRKVMNGFEYKVYNEAKKYLEPGELGLLNNKWKKAKYEGKYNSKSGPLDVTPIYDADVPPWIKRDYRKLAEDRNWFKKQSSGFGVKLTSSSEVDDVYEKNFRLPQERLKEVKQSPMQDLFELTKIDPKDVADKGALSTLYKHIKGERELSKGKAIEYAKALGVAPASLMFEPMTIPIWSYVKFSEPSDIYNTEDGATLPGVCYSQIGTETEVCPQDIYRVDVEGIKIKDKKSIYNGFIAYYYKTDKISDQINNKLCLIREHTGKTLLSGTFKYYLGICQLYGTEIRVLNPDPTSKFPVIAKDINPDLVAPIVSFTKPEAVRSDKVLSVNIKNVQKLGELIREEEENKKNLQEINLEKRTKQIRILEEKHLKDLKETQANLEKLLLKFIAEAETKAAMKKSFIGNNPDPSDFVAIPEFIKKGKEKKIA